MNFAEIPNGKPLSRRDFLIKGATAAGIAASANLLQGCANDPVKWKIPPQPDDTTENNVEGKKTLLEILADNKKIFDEKKSIDDAEFKKMFANTIEAIPDFEKIIAQFALTVKKEVIAITDLLPSLGKLFLKPGSPIMEAMPFPQEDTEKNIRAAIPGIRAEIDEKIFQYIQTLFQFDGALCDKSQLEEFMTNLIQCDFSINKFSSILTTKSEMTRLYWRLFSVANHSKTDPFSPFAIMTIIDLLNKTLLPAKDEKNITRMWHQYASLQTFLKNSGKMFPVANTPGKDPLDISLGDRYCEIPTLIMSDPDINYENKLDYLRGNKDLREYLITKKPKESITQEELNLVTQYIYELKKIYYDPTTVMETLTETIPVKDKLVPIRFICSLILKDLKKQPGFEPHLPISPMTSGYFSIPI